MPISPRGVSYANVWLNAVATRGVALHHAFLCPLVSAVLTCSLSFYLISCARSMHCVRTGVSEDSVHKRDAKLFEKLRLKLSKVSHSNAQTLVPERLRYTVQEQRRVNLVMVDYLRHL